MIGLKSLLGSIIKNLNKVLKSMKYFLLVIYASLLLVGCGDSVIPAKFIRVQSNLEKYEVHFQDKAEQWNDPDILAHPRAQFFWQAPGREETTIWSMRLDGTDLRETVDAELMNTPTPGGYASGMPVQRSPSGRYLAMHRAIGANHQRRIIDLETRQVDVIPSDETAGARFVWLNDHIILFRDESPLNAYDVLTKKVVDLSKEPEFKHLWILNYFVRDSRNPVAANKINKELIITAREGRFVYDYESRKLIETLKGVGDILSKGGDYWIDRSLGSRSRETLGGPSVYAFDDLTKELGRYGRNTNFDPMIINDINTLYSTGQKSLRVATINKPQVIQYSLPGKKHIANFSLYNTASVMD